MDLKGKAADAAGAPLKAGGENENLKAGDSQSSQELISAGGNLKVWIFCVIQTQIKSKPFPQT